LYTRKGAGVRGVRERREEDVEEDVEEAEEEKSRIEGGQ